MPLLRIADVTPLPGFRLRLRLTDGEVIERDAGPLLRGPVFEEIRNRPEAFAQVRTDGGTVTWPNGADLCPDALIWGGCRHRIRGPDRKVRCPSNRLTE